MTRIKSESLQIFIPLLTLGACAGEEVIPWPESSFGLSLDELG